MSIWLRTVTHISLSPLPIPKQPWQEISIDMIGPLPKSDNYDSILVIVNRFSKMIHLVPTMTSLSSTELAEIYKKEVWCHHGIPRRIISDRGPQFASKFMKELCNALGIERNLSTAYHPQTDGQTEQINQEVEAYLCVFINYRQNDWSKWLPTVEFQYNNKVHSGTKHFPFFLNYGLHPWKGTLSTTTPNPSANNFTTEIIKVHDKAKTAIQSYNGNMKDRGSDRRPKEKFMPGDSMWLEATIIHSNRPSAKLDNKRYCYGPQPYACLASICQSIRVCISPILVLS
jgi:hypothetical protein